DLDLVILRVDAAEAAVTARDVRAGVEPHHAVLIAGDAVGASGDAALVVELEVLHRAGPAVDLRNRRVDTVVAGGAPDVAGEVHLCVVHAGHVIHLGGRAKRPVGSVIGTAVATLHREVIFPDDHARRFTRRSRPQLEHHRAVARSARAGEIFGELALVELDIAGRLAVGPRVDAAPVRDL